MKKARERKREGVGDDRNRKRGREKRVGERLKRKMREIVGE